MLATRIKLWVQKHEIRFEGVSEAAIDVLASAPSSWPRGTIPPPDEAVRGCVHTGELRTFAECQRCAHFINIAPQLGRQLISVRCLCTDDDLVTEDAEPVRAWRIVAPELPVASARLLADAPGVLFLVVARGDELVGIVYRRDLEGGGDTVATRMTLEPWSLPSTATLGDALEAFRSLRVPGLLVVGPDQQLIGIVTPGDLARIGVPPELLP